MSNETKDQKFLFTTAVVAMFLSYLWAVASCPIPTNEELPYVFIFGVLATLVPALTILAFFRLSLRIFRD